MRFGTRILLGSFVSATLLLIGSFFAVQSLVVATVRNGLRSTLRETQLAVARMGSKSEDKSRRVLRVIGESAALKAGLQLMRAEADRSEARLTLEDQLHEICNILTCDFLLMSSPGGAPLAGVLREENRVIPMDLGIGQPPLRGFYSLGPSTYQVTSVPVDQGGENIGILAIGEHIDFSGFGAPVVLSHNGKVVASYLVGIEGWEIDAALKPCGQQPECMVLLHRESYLAMRMNGQYVGDGYSLHSFQNISAALAPVKASLQRVFLLTSLAGLLAALILSVFLSRSMVKPLARLMVHLRKCVTTGMLTELDGQPSPIQEIRELTGSLNRAAVSVREGREKLGLAYLEFVESMANALDARDPYTAGHSRRVSGHACAIGQAMNFPAKDLDEIRIGALLHDIGKIGIADSVLQKPGKLTRAEFALIQEHPGIGRQILAGVNGFQPYLQTVELHHENWDGTGYPKGLRGTETPLPARIVHVVDAYDAMTSDRPYRRGMSPESAVRQIVDNAGTQFDPAVVELFADLPGIRLACQRGALVQSHSSSSMAALAEAVSGSTESNVTHSVEGKNR
jgi:HD-GYP domain-containing protein (c-di-GMP phosphodiesterase class II)